jgi:hypothetical protein
MNTYHLVCASSAQAEPAPLLSGLRWVLDWCAQLCYFPNMQTREGRASAHQRVELDGAKLRSLAADKAITLAEVARQAWISPGHLSNAMADPPRVRLHVDKADAVAKVLGVDREEFAAVYEMVPKRVPSAHQVRAEEASA